MFYNVYNRLNGQVTNVDKNAVGWNTIQRSRIQGIDGLFIDWVSDYYWGTTMLGSTENVYDWDEQTWYCGILMSYAYDDVQARFGYPSGTPSDFALHVHGSGNPGVFDRNRVNYQRHDANAFLPIYFYENYSDYRVQTR